MLELGTSLMVVGVILIFVVLCIFLFDAKTLPKLNPGSVGSSCKQEADCGTGLMCSEHQCRIPNGGSCLYDPEFCIQGSVCHEGACAHSVILSPIPTTPIKPPEVIGSSVRREFLPATNNWKGDLALSEDEHKEHSGLYYTTTNPDDPNPYLITKEICLDYFYHNSRVYTLPAGHPNRLHEYDLAGNYLNYYELPFPCRGHLEVVAGSVYTLHNGVIWSSLLPTGSPITSAETHVGRRSTGFHFTPLLGAAGPIKAGYLAANSEGTYLYHQVQPLLVTEYILPIRANETLHCTPSSLVQTLNGRRKNVSKRAPHVTFCAGTLYQVQQPTKSYLRNGEPLYLVRY